MNIAVVTGSAGLIGGEAAEFLCGKFDRVVGIDNDLRQKFFGKEASTKWNAENLRRSFSNYDHRSLDIRDEPGVEKIFRTFGKDIRLVVHAAAQPSHDWAAKDPVTDFTVNANGTLNLLERTRKHCPKAVFIFTSTNKVYGDTPNSLPLAELKTRWEIESTHPYYARGIDENMSIDKTKHSVFGASKVAADVLVQEYARYFGMKTGVFRCGCVTGPKHSGAALHGFLSYLVRCAVSGQRYTIIGHKGKQVRDNIHSQDLVNMFWHFYRDPRPGEVYNAGGSRHSHCSILEAIEICREMTGKKMNVSTSGRARIGDHIWWISDVSRFKTHYPAWTFRHDLKSILREIHDAILDKSKKSRAKKQ